MVMVVLMVMMMVATYLEGLCDEEVVLFLGVVFGVLVTLQRLCHHEVLFLLQT